MNPLHKGNSVEVDAIVEQINVKNVKQSIEKQGEAMFCGLCQYCVSIADSFGIIGSNVNSQGGGDFNPNILNNPNSNRRFGLCLYIGRQIQHYWIKCEQPGGRGREFQPNIWNSPNSNVRFGLCLYIGRQLQHYWIKCEQLGWEEGNFNQIF